MKASMYGHLEVVRTLLEAGAADVNDKSKVRNQNDDDDNNNNNTINYLDDDDHDDSYRCVYVNNR